MLAHRQDNCCAYIARTRYCACNETLNCDCMASLARGRVEHIEEVVHLVAVHGTHLSPTLRTLDGKVRIRSLPISIIPLSSPFTCSSLSSVLPLPLLLLLGGSGVDASIGDMDV